MTHRVSWDMSTFVDAAPSHFDTKASLSYVPGTVAEHTHVSLTDGRGVQYIIIVMKLFLVILLLPWATGFTPVPSPFTTTPTRASHTRHYALLDVPDNFFTILLPSLSILLAFSKKNARSRLEERAWEQRLEEARSDQLKRDVTLTEIDLKKREAASEWSAYGNNNSPGTSSSSSSRRRARVMVQEQQERDYGILTDEQIAKFQQEFGVEYDPYYDDPYTEDELPSDVPFKVDKQYGDRIYQDGEIFYKDQDTGLYYRQGSYPRIKKFSWKL